MIKLRQDSRDAKYNLHFGQTSHFPSEVNFDTPIFDEIQPPGNVKCTCFTCCDIATDKDKIIYDIDDLFARVPNDKNGAEARLVLGEAIKVGFLPKGKTIRVRPFQSYWRADTGDMDAFDNVRSAMTLAELPIACWSPWYYEWMIADVLLEGKKVANYHMYAIEGWKMIDNEPHLIIEAWVGRKLYMSRSVFNKTVSQYGSATAVLSTVELDGKRLKTVKEQLSDFIANFIIYLKGKLVEKTIIEPVVPPVAPIVPEVKRDLLTEFCTAIRDFEGKPGDLNYKNNNPGNLRSVKGPFLKFKTYNEGWLALKDYVTRACTGKHKAYKPTFTIAQFFGVYAPSEDHNDPKVYANYVAKRIGKPVTMQIKDLL